MSTRTLLSLACLALLAIPPSILMGEGDGARPGRLTDHPRERAEWNAKFRRDARGRLASENRLRALAQACEVPADPSMDPPHTVSKASRGAVPEAIPGAAWESIGPRPAKSYTGWGTDYGSVAGRITALAVHPTNPSVLLLGAATGGIWKSTDGGDSWRPVSDTAPSLASSAIAFSPTNPSVVYAATGEVDSGYLEARPLESLGTYLGAGLLRSADGGETWTRIDVDLPPNAILSRVVLHPTDPNLVLVGIYLFQDLAAGKARVGGTYRSTDGGVHFTRTFTHAASDLVKDPNEPGTVWAGFGYAAGCTSCADESGVWRSTDFGATWSSSLVSSTSGAGFSNPTGNVKLGIGRTSPAVLYASILDTNSEHKGGGIFRTDDGGATWRKVNVHPDMCGGQCFYNHFVAPSPADPQTVFFGAVDLFGSTDGGLSWVKVVDAYGGGASVHPDQHAALLLPSAPRTLYLANDGGLYRSTDGGGTFANLNDTLTLAQFNGVTLHPSDARVAMGGTQDNGNLLFTGSYVWTDRTGGDGGIDLIRRDDPSQILAPNFYAFLNFSRDGGLTFADVTNCSKLMNCTAVAPREPMQFYPPLAAAPAAPGIVFLGTNRIWVHPGFGRDTGGWAPRSLDAVTTSTFTALEVVGDGSAVIWGGTESGSVLLSTDGGAHFAARSAGLTGAIVSRIRAVTPDGLTAYVTLGGFSGSPSKHVFRTTNGGQSWANVSGNLPDVPVGTLAVDPSDPNGLLAGTDVGVFRSTDGGASWTSFNRGLPNVTVTDLAVYPVSGDVIASTYGRGMFRIPAPGTGPLAPVADFGSSPTVPAPGQSVAFADRSAGAPTAYAWDFGDGLPGSSERSPRHVYSQPGSYPVRLTVSNAAGSSTKSANVVVASGVANPVILQVPVVLDVFGVAPAHFTSDLVAVNRSGSSTRLTLEYTAAPGTPGAGGPRIGETLEKGRELRIPDVIAYLRGNGYALSASGPLMAGTLRLTFEDVSDRSLVFAGSRTSTPNPNATVGGSFGLFASAVPIDIAPVTTSTIVGLREDVAFRSNLAVVDVPVPIGAAALSNMAIQLYDGDTGAAAGAPIAFTLQTGEWRQLSSILRGTGAINGWATVTKTGGGGNRFLAYGVVNDGPSSGGGTGDGSYLGPDAAEGLVPIVLKVTSSGVLFSTELTLTNPGVATSTIDVRYTPSSQLGGGAAGSASLTLGPRRQLRLPDAIAWLRDTLHLPLASGDVSQGGTLLISGAVASARTFNSNPDPAVGGTFGLAYPAVPASARARTEAWVYGLVQDGATRSNLAIADARVGDGSSVTYVVEIYDALSGDGAVPKTTLSVSLTGGQWYQFSKLLGAAGLTHAYVRVRPQAGTSDFVAYGVLNDGADFGQRTSDGSYVAMTSVR